MIVDNYDFSGWTAQDPIHGAINFGSIEKDIIDHSLFQRLHRLRQNALLYLIFPAANHTRFDHSMGVMCLADKFLQAIIKNQEKICKAGLSRTVYQDDYRVDDAEVKTIIAQLSGDPYYKISLRAAALFHDIGHGPLSHLFLNFFPSFEEMKHLTNNDEYRHIYTRLLKESLAQQPVDHEILSCVIATRVLGDISDKLKAHGIEPNKMAQDVCSIIDEHVEPSQYLTQHPYKLSALLHDIISNDIDADRMDFLLRDSHMCGVNYGLYDPDRILRSMCAYARTDTRELRVGVRNSGVGALEDFLFSRYQMYSQIYAHKTNRACYAMLMKIKERLDEVNWSWHSSCSTIDQLLDRFKSFSDHAFMEELRNKDTDYGAAKIKEITEKLFEERKLVKRVYEERISVQVTASESGGNEQDKSKYRFERFKENLTKKGIEFISDTFVNKGPKINDASFYLRVLKKDPVRGYYLVHELRNLSTVAKYLPEKEYTFRVFCKHRYVSSAKETLSETLTELSGSV